VLDFQTDIIQLGTRINELQSEKDALEEAFRRSQEQNRELDEQVRELEERWVRLPPDVRDAIEGEAADDETGGPYYDSPVPIVGEVTAVETVAGDTLVQVNVGTSDQVAENMKFLVYRDGEYKATIAITTVERQAAAGQVILSRGAIETGDSVLAGPS
jgi:hypothetical protein